jgi:hypothetical protein
MIPFICRKPSAKASVFSSPGRRQFSASLVGTAFHGGG